MFGRNPGLGSSARAGVNAEDAAADPPLEDPEDVSVTNSEVESVMNHRRRRESLCHIPFSNQEFNAFNSVDAYLGAARTGLEEIANLLSASVQASREQSEK